jgi:hypothetical protein
MLKISSVENLALVKLASSLPVGSSERKAILAALTAPSYLPKAGLTPFKKVVELMEEAPESLVKGRLLKLTQGMEASAKNFYNRGERFKPQARNVSEDAGELLALLSELEHPKEKELEKLLKGVIKDFAPIVKSLS